MVCSLPVEMPVWSAPTLAEYASRWSVAETRLDVAIGALAVGGGLAAVGIARFALVRRRAGNGPIALWLGPGTLGLGGKF